MIPASQRTKSFTEPSKADKSKKRYSLRSRAATTTGEPDGGWWMQSLDPGRSLLGDVKRLQIIKLLNDKASRLIQVWIRIIVKASTEMP